MPGEEVLRFHGAAHPFLLTGPYRLPGPAQRAPRARSTSPYRWAGERRWGEDAAHNGTVRFADRTDAGRRLGQHLREFAEVADVVVVGLPRGGVPVAHEVARALRAPLDVLLVHKIGVPFQPEFAMGAVGDGGYRVIDEQTVRWAGVTAEQLDAAAQRELDELTARGRRLRRGREPLSLAGRTVIVVDDGAATGLTALAACHLARVAGARRVVAAMPVASREAVAALRKEADDVVCVHVPPSFMAVGEWYEHFGQTSEAEVLDLLDRAERPGSPAHGVATPDPEEPR